MRASTRSCRLCSTSYEQHLTERRLADRALVYREALLHLDVCPIQAADLRVELPTVIWTPLERRLLDALPGTRVIPRALDLPGLDVPRRMTSLASPMETVAPAPASNAERLALLMSPTGAPASDDTLTMFCAGGREAEVEEVLRRIARSGEPLDQVEIACPMPEQAALVWEKAQRHEWPVTIGPGIPGRAHAAGTRAARLLRVGGRRAGREPAAAHAPVGRRASGSRRAHRGPGRADPGAGGGHVGATDVRSRARSSHRESPGGRAADPEQSDEARAWYAERAAQAERLKQWTAELLALVPEHAVAPLGQWLDATGAFVKTFARKASELDGEAAVALREALADLRALGDLARPASDALALIRGRFDGLTVGGDRARPGHLHVTTLADAGHAGRPRTFVIGLEEGGVFPALVEDPVLLDARAHAHRSGSAHLGGSRGRSALPHRFAPGQPGRPRLPELLLPRSAAGARHLPLVGAAAGGARAEARGELDLRPAGGRAGRARLRGAGRAGPGAERRGLVARGPAPGRCVGAAGGARGLPRPGAGRDGRGRARLRRLHRRTTGSCPRRGRVSIRACRAPSCRPPASRISPSARSATSSSAGSGSTPSTTPSPIPTCGSIR